MGRPPGKQVDLTSRELDTFKYMAEGKRCRDIAAITGLSPKTVETHIYRGLKRLGAESPCHAVAMLIKAGKI
jgi:LuxR family quorum sensing-dependent transcriptional regulator